MLLYLCRLYQEVVVRWPCCENLDVDRDFQGIHSEVSQILLGQVMDAEDLTPGVSVAVRIGDDVITIHCGEGKQTIRWLAVVAAQRYAAKRNALGRSKLRDSKSSPPSILLPSSVISTTSGSMLGPTSTIKDVVDAAQAAGTCAFCTLKLAF